MMLSVLLVLLLQSSDAGSMVDLADEEIVVDFVETVTVIDLPVKITRNRQPFNGVKKDDVELVENGVQLAVDSVRKAKVPLKIHFLFDLSTSNERQLLQGKRAVHTLIGKMKKNDVAKISLFSAYYQSITDYSGDKKALQN